MSTKPGNSMNTDVTNLMSAAKRHIAEIRVKAKDASHELEERNADVNLITGVLDEAYESGAMAKRDINKVRAALKRLTKCLSDEEEARSILKALETVNASKRLARGMRS